MILRGAELATRLRMDRDVKMHPPFFTPFARIPLGKIERVREIAEPSQWHVRAFGDDDLMKIDGLIKVP